MKNFRQPGAATGGRPGSGPAASASSGGSPSTGLRRRATGGSKSSGGGILRFYTEDSPGLKIGPTVVLVLSLLFISFVILLHIWGKFQRA